MSGNPQQLAVPGLGPLESAVMLTMWAAVEPLKVQQAKERLHYQQPLAYMTVKTVLDNLHHKGMITREQQGRAWHYTPARCIQDYLTQQLEDMTQQLCELLAEVERHQQLPGLQDTLAGGQADETIRFGFDGRCYEIDLSRRNAAKFRREMTPFIECARRVGGQELPRGRRSRPAGQSGEACIVRWPAVS